MEKEFEKVLALKDLRKDSDIKSFIDFDNNKILLYYNVKNPELHKFNNFHQLYEFLIVQHKSFYIYTNELLLIIKLYAKFNKEKFKIKLLCQGTIPYGLNCFNFIKFRDMKYKYGSNKFSAAAAIKIISNDKSDVRTSFTSNLGTRINLDSIKEAFPPTNNKVLSMMLSETPKGAIIFAKTNQEFTNVYCYDVVSAYIAQLLDGQLPYDFKQVSKMVKGKNYFVRFTFAGLKAKDLSMLPLYGTEKLSGKNIVRAGNRIVMAEEYSFYNFYDEIWIVNQYYTYDKVEIGTIYEVEFKSLPDAARQAIQKVYDDKLAAKGKIDYDGFKQIVNRIYGLFLMKLPSKLGEGDRIRDKTVPYQIGVWIIHRQRMFMTSLIAAVGTEHVVSAHTDGVKFDCNANEIIEKFNVKRNIYKNVGHWAPEEILDRCYYFSNTVAKYEINGKINMKHGGIPEADIIDFIKDRTYDDINIYEDFLKTISRQIVCEEDRTFIKREQIVTSIAAEVI